MLYNLFKEFQNPIDDQIPKKIEPSKIPKFNTIYIITGLTVIFIIITTGYLFLANTVFKEKTSPAEFSVPTPTESISPTEELIPTSEVSIPTNTPTPTPKPTTTNTPTPSPTATPTLTPTPTRVPNPPIINISYPQEGQYIEFTSPQQQLCIVDIPSGGDQSGIQRRHNNNDTGWSSYTTLFTYCYLPNEGSNRIQFQYRNQYGEESSVYTRQFNFHKAY